MDPEHRYLSVGMNPSPSDGELSVLFSGEGQPQPLHQMGPAIHDYYLIHTVLSGYGQFVIRDKKYNCVKGDTFVIFPGELFFYQADEWQPWHYIWVAFVGHGAKGLLTSLGVTPEQPFISGCLHPKIPEIYRQLHDCFHSDYVPDLSNLEAGGWVRLLLRQLGAAKRQLEVVDPVRDNATEHIIKQAIQFLSLQYTQSISIEHMSNMLGYHRTHLCKLFKQSTGVSPMQYLLKIRMQRAEALLATSMTVDQVASSVGYGDALYFSRKFRKWSGQSPSEYRQTLRTSPKR
ncbi:helix-turn-helix transcriptional regulator [Cohnella luojiensis]|uniref:AraC family transcriptional regulator n=1 Tax=Cohnella luojiensis TaxID=652876 RepID=A0A4Y8M8J8_9BACL|nr:AraC family transcriptional regulator [Cohnella luojiensis]TFE29435.1 AraC family transcriptional regulator [Cohnella luojiensis]